MRDDVLQKCPRLIKQVDEFGGGGGSAQVSDYQEHEDAGQQHASDHDELILGGSSFYESHHCVGQTQHVGHIQHLLMGPLCRDKTATLVSTVMIAFALHDHTVIICSNSSDR